MLVEPGEIEKIKEDANEFKNLGTDELLELDVTSMPEWQQDQYEKELKSRQNDLSVQAGGDQLLSIDPSSLDDDQLLQYEDKLTKYREMVDASIPKEEYGLSQRLDDITTAEGGREHYPNQTIIEATAFAKPVREARERHEDEAAMGLATGDTQKDILGKEYRDYNWESGDGKNATLPDGETNEWGGNLRNEGRKPLFRRDSEGKVNGYSTTSSTYVRDDDGKFVVIPTVVNGEELSEEDAIKHYKATGEYWGKTDDEESAKQMTQSVHENHAQGNQKAWNDYIYAHWDDMSKEITENEDMKGEHARRQKESEGKKSNPWADSIKDSIRSMVSVASPAIESILKINDLTQLAAAAMSLFDSTKPIATGVESVREGTVQNLANSPVLSGVKDANRLIDDLFSDPSAMEKLERAAYDSGISPDDIAEMVDRAKGNPVDFAKELHDAAIGKLKEQDWNRTLAQTRMQANEEGTGSMIATTTIGMAPIIQQFMIANGAGASLGVMKELPQGADWVTRLATASANAGKWTIPVMGTEMSAERMDRLLENKYSFDPEAGDQYKEVDGGDGLLIKKGDPVWQAALKGTAGGYAEAALFSLPIGEAAFGWTPKYMAKIGTRLSPKTMRIVTNGWDNYRRFSQFSGLRGQPTMIAIMDANMIKDQVFGLGVQSNEWKGVAEEWDRLTNTDPSKYNGQMGELTAEGQMDIFVSMMGLMALHGGGAMLKARMDIARNNRSTDAVLHTYFDVPQEVLDKADPKLKSFMRNILMAREGESGTKAMREGKGHGGDGALGSKFVMTPERAENFCALIGKKCGQANGEIARQMMEYALKADGTRNWSKGADSSIKVDVPAFNPEVTVDVEGKRHVAWSEGSFPVVMEDGKTVEVPCQTMVDNGTGFDIVKFFQTDPTTGEDGYVYLVRDPKTGNTATRYGLKDTIAARNEMYIAQKGNEAKRDMKLQFLKELYAKRLPGETPDVYTNPVDYERRNGRPFGNANERAGYNPGQDKATFFLDNIETPEQMIDYVNHEVGRHKGIRVALEVKDEYGNIDAEATEKNVQQFFKQLSDDPTYRTQLEYMARNRGITPEQLLNDPVLAEEAFVHSFDGKGIPAEPTAIEKLANTFRRKLRGLIKGLTYSRAEQEALLRGAMEKMAQETGGAVNYIPEEVDAANVRHEMTPREEHEERMARKEEGRVNYEMDQGVKRDAMGRIMIPPIGKDIDKQIGKELARGNELEWHAAQMQSEDPVAWRECVRQTNGDIAKAEELFRENARINAEHDRAKRKDDQRVEAELRDEELAARKEESRGKAMAAEADKKAHAEKEKQVANDWDEADINALEDEVKNKPVVPDMTSPETKAAEHRERSIMGQEERAERKAAAAEFEKKESERKAREAAEEDALRNEKPEERKPEPVIDDSRAQGERPAHFDGNPLKVRFTLDENGNVNGYEAVSVGEEDTNAVIAKTNKPKQDFESALRAMAPQLREYFKGKKLGDGRTGIDNGKPEAKAEEPKTEAPKGEEQSKDEAPVSTSESMFGGRGGEHVEAIDDAARKLAEAKKARQEREVEEQKLDELDDLMGDLDDIMDGAENSGDEGEGPAPAAPVEPEPKSPVEPPAGVSKTGDTPVVDKDAAYKEWLATQKDGNGNPLADSESARKIFDGLKKEGKVESETESKMATGLRPLESKPAKKRAFSWGLHTKDNTIAYALEGVTDKDVDALAGDIENLDPDKHIVFMSKDGKLEVSVRKSKGDYPYIVDNSQHYGSFAGEGGPCENISEALDSLKRYVKLQQGKQTTSDGTKAKGSVKAEKPVKVKEPVAAEKPQSKASDKSDNYNGVVETFVADERKRKAEDFVGGKRNNGTLEDQDANEERAYKEWLAKLGKKDSRSMFAKWQSSQELKDLTEKWKADNESEEITTEDMLTKEFDRLTGLDWDVREKQGSDPSAPHRDIHHGVDFGKLSPDAQKELRRLRERADAIINDIGNGDIVADAKKRGYDPFDWKDEDADGESLNDVVKQIRKFRDQAERYQNLKSGEDGRLYYFNTADEASRFLDGVAKKWPDDPKKYPFDTYLKFIARKQPDAIRKLGDKIVDKWNETIGARPGFAKASKEEYTNILKKIGGFDEGVETGPAGGSDGNGGKPRNGGQPGDGLPRGGVPTDGLGRQGGGVGKGAGPETGNPNGNPAGVHGGNDGVDGKPVEGSGAGDTGKASGAGVRGDETSPSVKNYEAKNLHIPGLKKSDSLLEEPRGLRGTDAPEIKDSSRPNIDEKFYKSGDLQEHQVQAIAQTKQIHGSPMLDNGSRRGILLGHRMGTGKTRMVAGIMLDNWNDGRKQSFWFSVNDGLMKDIYSDLTPFGLQKELYDVGDGKVKAKGIGFATYNDIIKDGFVDDLVKKLGRDFDGVIAFDECHKAKTEFSLDKDGKPDKGKTQYYVNRLQEMLPKARVVYLSATSATEVSDLGYAQRLGIWGEKDSPFKDFEEFKKNIKGKNLAGMEEVARTLKRRGQYLSCGLSSEGVKFVRTKVPTSDRVKVTYAKYNNAVREIYNSIYDSLDNLNNLGWSVPVGILHGMQQRMHNSMMSAVKLPSVIEMAKKDIAEGRTPVFSLVYTNAAGTERAVKGKLAEGEHAEMDETNFGPKQILREFLAQKKTKKQFGVEYEDYDFPTMRFGEPTVGADGRPVMEQPKLDPTSEAMRRRLVKMVDALPDDFGNPINMIMEAFGKENVANLTGINTEHFDDDYRAFKDGKKKVMVFSKKANTGYSFHTHPGYANKDSQRVMYVLQPGWRADDFDQTLGRVHRNGQVSTPIIVLPETDIPGEARFVSSVARRHGQLSSFTQGDRRQGANLIGEEDNYEDGYMHDAIQGVIGHLLSIDRSEVDDLAQRMNYVSVNKDGNRINKLLTIDKKTNKLVPADIKPGQFFNRMMLLEPDEQGPLFDMLMNARKQFIQNDMDDGKFDPGLQETGSLRDVELNSFDLADDMQIKHINSFYKTNKVSFDDFVKRFHKKGPQGEDVKLKDLVFVRNKRTGDIFAYHTDGTKKRGAQGQVGAVMRYSVNGEKERMYQSQLENRHVYELLDEKAAKEAWDHEFDITPDERASDEVYARGDMLRHWNDVLGARLPRTFFLKPEGAKGEFTGARLDLGDIVKVAKRFGKEKADAAVGIVQDSMIRKMMNGETVEFKEGWKGKSVPRGDVREVMLTGFKTADEAAKAAQLVNLQLHEKSSPRVYADKKRVFMPEDREFLHRVVEEFPVNIYDKNDTKVGDTGNLYFDKADEIKDNGYAEWLKKSGKKDTPLMRAVYDKKVGISKIYTGSSADYDKPSLIKVGSGEGGQAYGWGLYGSDVKAIAENYAAADSSIKADVLRNGKVIDRPADDGTESAIQKVARMIRRAGSVEEAKKSARKQFKFYAERAEENERKGYRSKTNREFADFYKFAIDELDNNEYSMKGKGRRLYEQTMFTDRGVGDESHLLSWYENIGSEKSKLINDLLEKEFPNDDRVDRDWKACDAYRALTKLCGSPKGASEFLARAGIDGVKYPADSFGKKTVKDGNKSGWNYVSFRDDNISIDHKWVNDEQLFFNKKDEIKVLEDPKRIEKYIKTWPAEDRKRIYRNMMNLKGTPWMKTAVKGVSAREEMERLVANPKAKLPEGSFLSSGMQRVVRGGEDSIFRYLADPKHSIIGHAAKPVTSVSGSMIDCNPSKECAKFCYTANGRGLYDNVVAKSELTALAIRMNPKRAAELTASQFKAMPDYFVGKSIRLLDRGDLSKEWVEYVRGLNANGVRAQIFSKRPEVLREIAKDGGDKTNTLMLSVDESNYKVALKKENAGLPVAVVWKGTQDNAMLEQFRERFERGNGVVLPIMEGRRALDAEEIKKVPEWARKHLCPIDAGWHTVGDWNCQRCDAKDTMGVGCFFKHTASALGLDKYLKVDERPLIEQQKDVIINNTKEIEDAIRKLYPGRDGAELIRAVGDLRNKIMAGHDPEGPRGLHKGNGGADEGANPDRTRFFNKRDERTGTGDAERDREDGKRLSGIIQRFGTTDDFNDGLIIAPSGRMVSSWRGRFGHSMIIGGRRSLQEYYDRDNGYYSRYEAYEDAHPEIHDAVMDAYSKYVDLIKREIPEAGQWDISLAADNASSREVIDGVKTSVGELRKMIAENSRRAEEASLDNFLRDGGIRIASNKGGLEIGKMPTEAQEDRVWDYVDWQRENNPYHNFSVDMLGKDGKRISANYDTNTPASKIISDIRDFYEIGKTPEAQSPLRQFYFNIGDEAGRRIHAKGLDDAKRMMGEGADRREIWKRTGWWQAKDGKWRYEIPGVSEGETQMLLDFVRNSGKFYDKDTGSTSIDSYAFTLDALENELHSAGKKLPDSLKTLMAAYPRLAHQRIVLDYKHPKTRAELATLGYSSGKEIRLYKGGMDSETFNHELQHKIQEFAGMGRGTNPSSAGGFDRYQQEHGEWEARLASARANMTDAERADEAPWETRESAGIKEEDTKIGDYNRARIRPDGVDELPPPETPIVNEKRSAWNKYMENIQDRLHAILETERKLGRSTKDIYVEGSPYNAMRLLPGHQEASRVRYENIWKKPFEKMLKDGGVTADDVGYYMMAKDVPARNAKVLARNGRLDGSGMTEKMANDFLADMEARLGPEKMKAIKQAADHLWAMQREGLERRLASGRISQEMFDKWTSEEPFHVPMRTDYSEESDGLAYSTKQWRQNDFKTAEGRQSVAASPVEFMLKEYQEAMYGSNENDARKVLANFVRMHPELGTVKRGVKKTKGWSFTHGQLEDVVDPYYHEQRVKGGDGRPNLVAFKDGGDLMMIDMNGNLGERLAGAVTGRDVVRAFPWINAIMRPYASTATEWSPTFAGRNFVADLLESSINTIGDKGVLSGSLSAAKNVVNAVRMQGTINAYNRTGEFKGKFADVMRKYVESGASIGGAANEGFSEIKAEMAKIGKHSNVVNYLKAMGRMLSLYNKQFEMATRLAVFKDCIDSGYSLGESAMRSREYSTDFNKYGNQRWTNSIWMFSGSVVGSATRQVESIVHGKKGLQMATGLFAFGMIEALMEHAFNADYDEESKKKGEPSGDTMTDYNRANSIYFRVGDRFYRIPFHAGPFSTIKYAGNKMMRYLLGDEKMSPAVASSLKEVRDTAFHFLGTGDAGPDVMQSFLPTMAVPFYQAWTGVDFAGRPIERKMYSETKPYSENGRSGTGEGFKWGARLLNELSGGNKTRRGSWDVSPEMLEHVWNSLGKNTTRDITKIYDTVNDLSNGTIDIDHLPFASDFNREVRDNTQNYYDANRKFRTIKDDTTVRRMSPERIKSLVKLQEEIIELRHWENGEKKINGKWVSYKNGKVPNRLSERWKAMRLKKQQRMIDIMKRYE